MDSAFQWIAEVVAPSSYQCSATPSTQAFLLSILVISIAVTAGGVYVWGHYIRTQPESSSKSQ